MNAESLRSRSAFVRVGDLLLDQYRVDGLLGEGGMGTVYAVSDVRTKQVFAMKVVVDTKDEELITRFVREGRATMRLKSDHVVRVYDVGSLGEAGANVPFMVMERLEGKTLKDLVGGKPLDERTVADLMLQACEGLAHAHALGIVHRDVKPSNLFVMHGAEKQLKVLDFGISRMTTLEDWERTASVTVTETHALLGSPHYSSPEQLQSPSSVDARADVWSLGVSMYYALSGRLPFGGNSLAELLVAVMSKEPAPLSPAGRGGVSGAMVAIVARCLERNIEKRYRNVADLAEALAPHASPRRASLAERVKSVLETAPKRVSVPPPPPPPRGVADRTLTVDDEPLPHSAPAIPADASFEIVDTTRTMKREDRALDPELPSRPMPLSASPSSPARRSSAVMGFVLGVLALVVVIGLVVAGVTLRKSSATSTTPTPPSMASSVASSSGGGSSIPIPSAAVATQASAEPSASSIELELIADARIAKVIRPETRRIVVEEGRAVVTVAPFARDLPIEVELANGARAKGIAKAGGSKSIHLTALGGAPRAGQTKPPPSGAAKPAKSGNELHGSPYQ